MSEAGLRQALVGAIIAAVIGVVALALGAFVAPIPTQTDASRVATALFVRGVLALVALALAFYLSYRTGFRIETLASQEPAPATPPADPSASSPIVDLFMTPGSRRDAFFAGGIVMLAYWLLTSLYILALGKIVGNLGVNNGDVAGFIGTRTLEGLALIVAGMAAGAFGARAAFARQATRKALSIPSIPPALPPDFPPSATAPGSPPAAGTSDGTETPPQGA